MVKTNGRGKLSKIMYPLLMTAAMFVAYLGLHFVMPYFFKGYFAPLNKSAWRSLFYIGIVSFVANGISIAINDPELGNRVLHAFGGGFLAFMTCYLVVKDSRLAIYRFQFFLFAFMAVISLGVANEIMEYFGQNYAGQLFAPNINDTWLDLISNCVGALIAAVCFVPLVKSASPSLK